MLPLHTSLLSRNNAGAPENQPAIFQLLIRNNEAKDLVEAIAAADRGAPRTRPPAPFCVWVRRCSGSGQPPAGQRAAGQQQVPAGSCKSKMEQVAPVRGARAGAELTGRPFLWVAQPDFTTGLSKAWLHEFQHPVGGSDMIVSWCPQQPPAGGGAPCGGVLPNEGRAEWQRRKVERVLDDDGIRDKERVDGLRDAESRSMAAWSS
nr:unnamed protein product [Digitaria exilis]